VKVFNFFLVLFINRAFILFIVFQNISLPSIFRDIESSHPGTVLSRPYLQQSPSGGLDDQEESPSEHPRQTILLSVLTAHHHPTYDGISVAWDIRGMFNVNGYQKL